MIAKLSRLQERSMLIKDKAMTTEILFAYYPWMFPSYRWEYYGKILYESKSYAEFAMKSVIRGYVNPDQNRRYDEKIDLICRYEPYECFIYEEAGSWRGTGKMSKKAAKFRDEMIELEKQNGERDVDGFIIPTKWTMQHSKQNREWCHIYHPEYFKIRDVEDDIVE